MSVVEVIDYSDGRGTARQVTYEANPRCGDFCDGCGDCLYCYGSDYCPNGMHTWIVYIDNDSDWDEFIENHPEAQKI